MIGRKTMNKIKYAVLAAAFSVPQLVSAGALEQLRGSGDVKAGINANSFFAVTAIDQLPPAAAAPEPRMGIITNRLAYSAAETSRARVYGFKALFRALGYPSPDYFGSSEDEVQDVGTYTDKEDSFYKEVNDYLRYYPEPYEYHGTTPEMARDMVKNIDRVFARVPALPADFILFRGIGLKYHGNKPYELGEEFTDKGYVSTSASYKVARYFAVEMDDNPAPEARKAILTIYFSRPGQKGILVDQREDEVILRHGTKYRVMGIKDNVKKYDLYLVQVCADSCDAVLRKDVAAFWAGFKVQD